MCFDNEIHNYLKFDNTNKDDILKYKLYGGIGTMVGAVWNFWMLNDRDPDLAIFFSDGHVFDSWGPPDYCKTLWIMTGVHKTFGNHFAYSY